MRNLQQIADAENTLRTDCADVGVSKMTRDQKGVKLLIWPERYSDCERSARLVRDGDSKYLPVIRALNKTFHTRYPLPTGDAQLASAWDGIKTTIAKFGACDDVSRKILLADSAEQGTGAFEANKKSCPAEWVALFAADDSQGTKKGNCGNSALAQTGATVNCLADSTASKLDVALNALKDDAEASSAKNLRPGSAGDKIASSGRFRQGAQDAYNGLGQKALAATPVFGGTSGQIIGAIAAEQTGHAAGTGAGAGSTASGPFDNADCDSNFESNLSAQYSRDTAGIDAAQVCALTRTTISMLTKLRSFAQRCRSASVPSIDSAIAQQRSQQAGCGG
ncbi:hypothetical protein [Paraburkholderia sediminicola]|uniref:hypothetical protein n=1 Tax=Paraburkholderia sediminicola TaxID=458836 RepID=UPI0038B95AA1